MFLCRNHQVAPDFDADPADPARHDRIFAFGFSRGAFTARVVAGLVTNQGLICSAKSDRDLIRLARWAYRRYRADRYRNSIGVRFLRTLRNGVFRIKDMLLRQKPYDPSKNRKVDINFLGVFDTCGRLRAACRRADPGLGQVGVADAAARQVPEQASQVRAARGGDR
jgi:hypothetical protein